MLLRATPIVSLDNTRPARSAQPRRLWAVSCHTPNPSSYHRSSRLPVRFFSLRREARVGAARSSALASAAQLDVGAETAASSHADGPVILWFKRDLRLDDHDALMRAGKQVVCFLCFDDRLPATADEAYWAAASSLRASLAAAGSALVVRSGRTEEELSKLAAAVGARTIFAEEEVVHEWRTVLDSATASLATSGVSVSLWRPQLWASDGDSYNWRTHVATRGALVPPTRRTELSFAPLPPGVAPGELPARPQRPAQSAAGRRSPHPVSFSSPKGVEAAASWLQVVGSSESEVLRSLTDYLQLTPGRVTDAAADIDADRPDTSFASLFSAPLSLGLVSHRQVAASVEEARVALSLMSRLPWDKEADKARCRGRSALAAIGRRAFHERLGSADVQRSVAGAAQGRPAAAGSEIRYWLWRGHIIPYVAIPCRSPRAAGAGAAAPPPNVLLVHGFGAFGEHFRGTFDSLSESCNVFAPTFPGFGRSEKGGIPYSQVLWTEFLRDFIEEIVKGPAFVAGNSIGGFMCANLAADYPQLVRGLALINSAGPITPNYDAAAAAAAPPKAPPAEAVVMAATGALLFYLERNIPDTLRKCYPTFPDRADEWLAEEIFRAACDPGAPQVFGSVFYLPAPRPLNYLVQRFGGPTVVLQGALDPLNDATGRARSLGELCPGIKVELLQAGHCPHDEDPEGFQRGLLAFVSGVEAGAAGAGGKTAAAAGMPAPSGAAEAAPNKRR